MTNNSNYYLEILKKRWVGHIVFWFAILVFSTLQSTLFNNHSLHYNFISYLALIPSQIIAGYVLTYYLIPKYIFKKKYLKFVISFLIMLFVLAILARLITVYFAEPIIVFTLDQESVWEIFTDPVYALTIYAPALYINPFLFASLNIIVDKIRERNKIETLEKRKN